MQSIAMRAEHDTSYTQHSGHHTKSRVPRHVYEKYSFQLFVLLHNPHLSWEMQMLPSNAPCWSSLPSYPFHGCDGVTV